LFWQVIKPANSFAISPLAFTGLAVLCEENPFAMLLSVQPLT
jgi:hypothetical protein